MTRLLLTILIFSFIIKCGFSQNDDGLIDDIKGIWISTVLPDSVQENKIVLPWRDIFYGFLLITINDDNTLIIQGNMDRGSLKYCVIDSVTIGSPDLQNLIIKYSKHNDLIYLGNYSSSRVFRRITDDNLINIIRDKKQLENYIIQLIFSDYFPDDDLSKIVYISLGLETYTPFTFDAIAIDNGSEELDYFGWEIINDTLRLYKTYEYIEFDSGFQYFRKGEIDSIIINN